MATLTASRPVARPALLHPLLAPFRGVGRFFVSLRGAAIAAAEVESLSHLSDEALARRGLSRHEIARAAMRHLDV